VKNRFQNLPFKFNLQRYTEEEMKRQEEETQPPPLVGLCTFNSADPSFESIWFQPLYLKCDLLVANFAFKWVNLYRYTLPPPPKSKLSKLTHLDLTAGGCTS
jgi:hypothetical protein